MSILVIAEHDNNQLKSATANTVAAAQKLSALMGSSVDLAVLGQDCQSVVTQASSVEGIDNVLVADSAAVAHQLPENLAPFLADLVQQKAITHVLFCSTAQGKNVAPRVAALLDVAQISEVTDIIDEATFIRPTYAGNALAKVKTSDPIKVLTIRSTAFDGVDMTSGAASVVALSDVKDQELSRFITESVVESDRPELTSARVVISGGRGMQNGENFSLLESVADKIGAAVGASRAAVDAGYVSNDMQVGQTGKIVAPDLYIAVGISGAIQHLAGMKESKVIVAINNDEEAPIFNVADLSLHADLFEALPELEKTL
ncbi:FAD-binding protein [Marinomonas sp. C2222]|uniref:FAD-binding protein n=1 Tax=Marinomonas sargassi TaxID=2984494 RepID=A0ABT2YPZ6_9GAMM|nr:FAD-binding protein [Marinomonas sargassi]MCV2401926.1 FAD-binding protein [Marinomonas sargassi]